MYDHLKKLQSDPVDYFSDLKTPLRFYTEDYKKFFSTGCSRKAIIAKNYLTLYKQLTGHEKLIKAEVVKVIVSNNNLQKIQALSI